MKAYWFCKEDMTAAQGNEPPWTVGETRTLQGELVMCKHGYHSSPTITDALTYITGPVINLVEIGEPDLSQSVGHNANKYVSRSRQIIKSVDLSGPLRLLICDIADRENERYEQESGKPAPEEARLSVLAGRKFAAGEITREEMKQAHKAISSSYYDPPVHSYASLYTHYASHSSPYSPYRPSHDCSDLIEAFGQRALEALENG